MLAMPEVSLIIPSSRPETVLAHCLQSIAAQHFDQRRIEVVVVFNGPSAAPRIAAGVWPFELRTSFMAEASICAAKNRALALATAPFLILLNDDVRLSPGFIAAHLRAHKELGRPALVLGSSPWAVYEDETLFDRLIAETSMIFFYDRMQPHAWFNFRHAWNLNLSFYARDAGGLRFDERLAPVNFDDVEWAFRLEQQHGLRVWYEPAATLIHAHRYTLDRYLEREAHLGRMAVRLWECNPACFEAIYGGDLWRVVEKAREFVVAREREAQEVRDPLRTLAARPASQFHLPAAGMRELVTLLYVAHLPLKRFRFYRALLDASGEGVGETLCDAPGRA